MCLSFVIRRLYGWSIQGNGMNQLKQAVNQGVTTVQYR
jgi:hypothetical protein